MEELIKFTCVSKVFHFHFYLHRSDANSEQAVLDLEKRINDSKICTIPG